MTAAQGNMRDSTGDRDVNVRLTANLVQQSACWNDVFDVSSVVTRAVDVVTQSSLPIDDGRDGQVRDVTIVLSEDADVRQLNKSYRQIDKPTNVLSFPSLNGGPHPCEDGPAYLGDIVLSYETIKQEALVQGRDIQDHISHLVIHGLLHLFGYDHDTDEAAEHMEQLEIQLLAKLAISNPYSSTLAIEDIE